MYEGAGWLRSYVSQRVAEVKLLWTESVFVCVCVYVCVCARAREYAYARAHMYVSYSGGWRGRCVGGWAGGGWEIKRSYSELLAIDRCTVVKHRHSFR